MDSPSLYVNLSVAGLHRIAVEEPTNLNIGDFYAHTLKFLA